MTEMPEQIDVQGTTLVRMDAPDEITCWTVELPGPSLRSVSILIEPAGLPSQEALDTAAAVIDEFDGLVVAASDYLVAELADPAWELDEVDRARLAQADAPFDVPEAVVWVDGTWMIRFAESGLAMGDEYGIGVLFVGRSPVAVEDLSEADEFDDE